MLYISVLTLMSTTYLTDNTAFYFWCMMALRLIPLSYGVYRKNKFGVAIKEEKAKWSPPSQTDFQQLVREQMAKVARKTIKKRRDRKNIEKGAATWSYAGCQSG